MLKWLRLPRKCAHIWRPAVTSYGPAKLCAACDKLVHLTKEEYYAQFGTLPHTWY